MADDDFCPSPYWCPFCGDPREVCESFGGCDKPGEDDEAGQDFDSDTNEDDN